MLYEHISVLARQALDGLDIKPDGVYLDGTLGLGGHAAMICEKLSARGRFIGIDLDKEAIRRAEDRLRIYECDKIVLHGNFADVCKMLADNKIKSIDGALLDLGVSSPQLDDPLRGFSYMQPGPLDMRMNADEPIECTDKLTAYEVVNTYSEEQLSRLIRSYGEERWSRRIASFIVRARAEGPIESTDHLTEIIKAAIPASARREGPHPAKRTFQAIRIEVNGELENLRNGLESIVDVLSPGGRVAVITFHSLEDRIVKEMFVNRENPCTCPPGIPECVCGNVPSMRRLTKKPIRPEAEEADLNPRARSAKLRVAEKL